MLPEPTDGPGQDRPEGVACGANSQHLGGSQCLPHVLLSLQRAVCVRTRKPLGQAWAQAVPWVYLVDRGAWKDEPDAETCTRVVLAVTPRGPRWCVSEGSSESWAVPALCGPGAGRAGTGQVSALFLEVILRQLALLSLLPRLKARLCSAYCGCFVWGSRPPRLSGPGCAHLPSAGRGPDGGI